MTPKQRAARALAPLIQDATICLSCRRLLAQRYHPSQTTRTYASASATAVAPASSQSPSPNHASTPTSPRPTYAISAGIQLSRPPMLTRPLHPFEKAFFLYQKRLNERLALPFTRYFYYKKGTPADLEWKRKMRERASPARDIGNYTAYGPTAWNDEVVLGSADAGLAEEEAVRERLVRDVQGELASEAEKATAEEDAQVDVQKEAVPDEEADAAARAAARRRAGEVERPRPRISEADISGDQTSLDRLGWRTLYLLVREGGEKGGWMFPRSRLQGRESLRTAAERVIVQAGGVNMNTWIVGNVPVSHYAYRHPSIIDNAEQHTMELGEKVFLLKGRIMAGQANLSDNKLGLSDFKWLAKEEIKELVRPNYWRQVENSLAER